MHQWIKLIGIFLVFTSLSSVAQESWLEKMKSAGKKVSEGTKEAWDATTELSKDAWDATADFSEEAWKNTKEWSSAAWDKSSEWVEQGEKALNEMLEPESPDDARNALNTMSNVSLAKLFQQTPSAKAIFDQAYGYAVFDSRKFSLLIHTNGGSGVAVDKLTGERYYMNMFGAGLALGIGGKFYQQIMLFETREKFNAFVSNQWHDGWEGSTEAGAVMMDESAELGLKFSDGMAVFVLNDKGLLVDANLTGSKYWLDDDLN